MDVRLAGELLDCCCVAHSSPVQPAKQHFRMICTWLPLLLLCMHVHMNHAVDQRPESCVCMCTQAGLSTALVESLLSDPLVKLVTTKRSSSNSQKEAPSASQVPAAEAAGSSGMAHPPAGGPQGPGAGAGRATSQPQVVVAQSRQAQGSSKMSLLLDLPMLTLLMYANLPPAQQKSSHQGAAQGTASASAG